MVGERGGAPIAAASGANPSTTPVARKTAAAFLTHLAQRRGEVRSAGPAAGARLGEEAASGQGDVDQADEDGHLDEGPDDSGEAPGRVWHH
ncbi:hypothetical protein AB0C61_18095 [Streptomyces sp. NPDC048680]|uniref:hypothetical protein n=1 Tax=Streptomyces sp. NPDC048680 TaxID=3155492 RepID=UPI0034391669